MERGNQTSISEFLLLGLSDREELQQLLFILFLWMYLFGVLGSLTIALAIGSDPHLHTPMYFFLTNLSLADICFLSTTVLKMLINIQTHSKSISYAGCLVQMYFFILFISLDHFLLTGMAYDRYVAIRHPLHYTAIMSPRLCALTVAGSWILSSLHALTHTLMGLQISFCADNKIHHFFCEPIQIIKLSCKDPLINEILLCDLGALLGLGPLTGLLFSYNRIISTILRIPSAGSLLHLRNKDMKGALRKFMSRKSGFFQRLSSGPMEKGNQTSITEFLLLGLSDWAKQWQLLFVLFLWFYLLGVVGNLLIVLAISSDPHLHTPMYFFLTNLSLADICFLSTTVPKILVNIQNHDKSISYAGCLAQMYFFILFGGLDHFLITGMAYDRYEAICHPLHYTTIMSPRLCSLLVAGSWIFSSLHALIHTLLVVRLSFCSNREILHFFCELYQILELSCFSVIINKLMVFVFAALIGVGPIFGLLFSYIRIISTILRIPSAGGRWKAFSTCGSHLSVVSLFYSIVLGTYLCPTSTQAFGKGLIVSVLYTVVIPTMNPFIYSLRNKNMKEALRNTFNRKSVFSRGF
ncbi:olfactory receptor-like protein OLF4 [Tachyglossus aculeatus]|uniref:olfactory receptor-like protein OLF4 n=1 Tax=Tachyglossus aculeatus TaxID=9261 RepID=UPI0018F53620|nr:olfactory receptor-like protein OLF4 [Tachyglossus aculeatus]